MPLRRFRRQYEQLSQFERGKNHRYDDSSPWWSARRVSRQLGRSDCFVSGQLRVLFLLPTHRRLRLEWCRARGNCTIAEWN
ncbi:hypothetical protein TNCV_792151 [Trichonephila clavipes]|nr:hypothetical protein TNCV_792151 [Trichonephila clavipes]